MTQQIDNRVVSVRFDNSMFERKVSDTIKAVGNLENSLKMANGVRGLESVNSSLARLTFDPAIKGVEAISAKFIALSTIAVTALSRITDKVISVGATVTDALSIGSIKDGFREYETNMNSIQTIMSNTAAQGTTLDQVNAALAKLNEYSDTTIYNFGEMAKNIGTFTAAGVDLDTSVSSIKGIANLAAISGSSSQQASNAMYQLSQAIATGTLKVIDWNSVNAAGMGGKVFKEALWETGKALGKITDSPVGESFDEWEKKGKTFRESLSDEWLTSDVLTTTLKSFTGDLTEAQIAALGYTEEQAAAMFKLGQNGKAAAQDIKTLTQLWSTMKESSGSGWSESMKLIIGDFGEAKTLLTGISNVFGYFIGRSADARNETLKFWRLFGGRDALIQGIKNAFVAFLAVLKPIKEAFHSLFPKAQGDDLARWSKAFERFTKKLIVSSETAGKIKKIFTGLFSVFKIVFEVIKQAASYIGSFSGKMDGSGTAVLDFTTKIANALTKFKDLLVDGKGIKKFFDGLPRSLDDVKAIFDRIFNPDSLKKFTDKIPSSIAEIKSLFGGTFDTQKAEGFFDSLKQKIDSVKSWFKGIFDDLPTLSDIPGMDTLKSLGDNLVKRFAFLKTVFSGIGEAFGFITDKVSKLKGVFTEIVDFIKRVGTEISEAINDVFKPSDSSATFDALNVGMFAGLIVLVKKISDSISNFAGEGGIIDTIKGTFEQLTETMGAMQSKLKAEALMKIALAVGVLTLSIVVLAAINPASLTKSLVAISAGFGILVLVMKKLDDIASDTKGAAKLATLAGAMILLAGSMLILAIAVKILSSMSFGELTKGLLGVGVGLGIMVSAINHMTTDTRGLVKAGVAIAAIAIAMIILAAAVKLFSMMSLSDMAKGLLGVGLSLAIMIIGINSISSDTSGMLKAAISIGFIAAALILMSVAVKAFSMIKMGDTFEGLIGIAATLAILVIAMKQMPASLPATALGLIGVSIALSIMAGVVAIFGSMSWTNLAKGLVSVAGLMLILALGVNAMSGAIVGAAAMVIVAGALVILADVVKTLGELSLGDIVKALLAIAGVFLVVAGLSVLLSEAIPFILGFGIALMSVAAAIALFGAGAYLFAMAFDILGRAGVKGGKALVFILTEVAKLIPLFIAKIVTGLIDAVVELGNSLPPVIKAVVKILGGILDGLIVLVPKVIELLGVLLGAIIELIRKYQPKIFAMGFELLISFLTGIRDNIGKITDLVSEIITKFLNKLADNIGKIIDAGANLIVKFLEGLNKNSQKLIDAGVELLVSFLGGLADNAQKITDAVTDLLTKIIEALAEGALDLAEAGTDALVAFLGGLTENVEKILTAVGTLVTNIITGLADLGIQIASAGTNALISFLTALTGDVVAITNAVTILITTLMTEFTKNAIKIADTGTELLVAFLGSLTDNAVKITEAVTKLITTLIEEFGKNVQKIIDAGTFMVVAFLVGLTGNVEKVATAVTDFIVALIEEMSKNAQKIVDAGGEALASFLQGIADNIQKVCDAAQEVIKKFAGCLGELWHLVVGKGWEAVTKFVGGIADKLWQVLQAGGDLIGKVAEGIGNGIHTVVEKGPGVVWDFITSLVDSVVQYAWRIYNSATDLAGEVINGLIAGFVGGVSSVVDAAVGLATDAINGVKSFLGINSPSKVAIKIAGHVVEGLAIGLNNNESVQKASTNMGKRLANSLSKAVESAASVTNDIVDLNPSIRPVLDLSDIRKGAAEINNIGNKGVAIGMSDLKVAKAISAAKASIDSSKSQDDSGPSTTTFVQNNYSPEALTTEDIYRNTKSQIAMKKGELDT